MKKEEKEVKEVKENVKDYSIESDKQSKLKKISRVLAVIAKIVRIFAFIAIGALVLFMIFVPICTANIKVVEENDQKILRIFDNDVYYKRTENSFEIYKKGKEDDKTVIKEISEIKSLNKAFDYLEKNDLTATTIFIEVEMAVYVAILVITAIVMKKTYLFFMNIHDKTSPFIKENVELLGKIGKLLIYSLILSVAASIISSLYSESSVSISFTNVFEILYVYCLLYIFEYGYKLQNDTKGKIYSE